MESSNASLKASLNDSTDLLEASIQNIAALQPSLDDPYDQEAALQAISAAESRLAMIESGIFAIDCMSSASNALNHAEDAWVYLVEADALLREAAELASNTSKETISQSMEKSKAALDSLEKVKPSLAAA